MSQEIIHYPFNLRKYEGSIQKRGDKYRYINKANKIYETYPTKEEAEDRKRQYSIANGLVKNIIYQNGDVWEMELTQGKRSIIDEDEFLTVDEYIWYANRGDYDLYYACTNIGNKT